MPPRILVVDDEPAVTDLLAYNLRGAYYYLSIAVDGRAALRLAGESKPDLMIPEVDGLDGCRELCKSSGENRITIRIDDDILGSD